MADKLYTKKNVLIFFWYFEPPGGAEVFIEETAKHLSPFYNFEMLTAKCKSSLPKEEKYGEILIHRVGIGNFMVDKILFPIFSLVKAFRIQKNKKISLVHGIIANPAGLSAAVFSKLTKVPFLLTEQSGNLHQKVKKLGPITFWLYKKIYQKTDFLHVISKFLKETILGLGVDEKKIEVIPNGINLSEFRRVITESINPPTFWRDIKPSRKDYILAPPQTRGYPKGGGTKEKYQIVSVARLEKYKGIKYLISAMPKILEKFPEAKLLLVGDGSQRENLELRIRNLGLENKVKFKGDIPHNKIPGLLASSELFVLPSLEEGQGVVILEAQAAQIPVIATRVGGITDFIKDGENGILIPPADFQAISQAVIKIFSEPEFAQKLVQNANKNLEEYDWHKISERINSIYQKLISQEKMVVEKMVSTLFF